MKTRKSNLKRHNYDSDFAVDDQQDSFECQDFEDADYLRKSRIRVTNKEHIKRMTILQSWSEYWIDYTTREGPAYPKEEALSIIKKSKKIACPIPSCQKTYTTVPGLKYHYARCNMERYFKCKVCEPPTELKTRGDLLRHMIRSHYDQLPELNDEQKEIANAYRSTTGRIDRSKVRRFHSDLENQLSCKQLLHFYHDLINRAYAPEAHSKLNFRYWCPNDRDWEHLTFEIDRRRYYPPETESVYIKLTDSWFVVQAGDSISSPLSHNSNYSTIVFFTGGINTCTAWLPKPPITKVAHEFSEELIAIAVNCCTMEKSPTYKDAKDQNGCIQFWSAKFGSNSNLHRTTLEYMVGHNYGVIFEMVWCPLGVSWNPSSPLHKDSGYTFPRVGLLALACGDGQVRIINVPHVDSLPEKIPSSSSDDSNLIESTRIFRVKPAATLVAPGVGPSTDYQVPACTSLCWNIDDNQRLIAAGYANGFVAVFDLANLSPILYMDHENRHIYHPYKSWHAHSMPVTGIAIQSSIVQQTLIASGSRDRQMKFWNLMDLNACLSYEKAPITKLVWDYRFRGVVSASETAFTSFHNRVSYRYPGTDGNSATLTLSTHRATVWGLSGSIVTSALAASDEAGELFVMPFGRPAQKKDRVSYLSAHSLYTAIPQQLDEELRLKQHTRKYSSLPINSHMTFTTGQNFESHSNEHGVFADHTPELDFGKDCMEVVSEGEPLEEINEDNHVIDDYNFVERSVANKPAKFLLPINHRAVESYSDFKQNFGLEFITYSCTPKKELQQLPDSCSRANDTSKIFCDRVCDYPFSSIRHLSWSPNASSYQYLLSSMHNGLCRIDKVEVIENLHKVYLETD